MRRTCSLEGEKERTKGVEVGYGVYIAGVLLGIKDHASQRNIDIDSDRDT